MESKRATRESIASYQRTAASSTHQLLQEPSRHPIIEDKNLTDQIKRWCFHKNSEIYLPSDWCLALKFKWIESCWIWTIWTPQCALLICEVQCTVLHPANIKDNLFLAFKLLESCINQLLQKISMCKLSPMIGIHFKAKIKSFVEN